MASHNQLGKLGEKIALQYLLNKGYTILEKNYRVGKIEIDLIVEIENIIVFVEVKTRSTDYYGEPYEAVDDKKEKFMINGAQYFIDFHQLDNEVRFDLISIVYQKSNMKINHIIDAFNAREELID